MDKIIKKSNWYSRSIVKDNNQSVEKISCGLNKKCNKSDYKLLEEYGYPEDAELQEGKRKLDHLWQANKNFTDGKKNKEEISRIEIENNKRLEESLKKKEEKNKKEKTKKKKVDKPDCSKYKIVIPEKQINILKNSLLSGGYESYFFYYVNGIKRQYDFKEFEFDEIRKQFFAVLYKEKNQEVGALINRLKAKICEKEEKQNRNG